MDKIWKRIPKHEHRIRRRYYENKITGFFIVVDRDFDEGAKRYNYLTVMYDNNEEKIGDYDSFSLFGAIMRASEYAKEKLR